MFCFTSKYALALYEMVQKRGNLKHKHVEEFSVGEMRGLLGVPRSKLTEFADLRRKALIPAVDEVNALSPFMVQLDAVRHGRKVIKLRLIWFAKDEQGLKAAYCEVQRHKAGRKARVSGLAEVIAGPTAAGAFDDDLEALP
jgi:plasmid replication initiation protein